MDYAKTYRALETFLRDKVLRGEESAIEEDTPLLEWGILTSLTTMELVAHIQQEFGISIPVDRMFGDNFKDLRSITRLVVELGGGTPGSEPQETATAHGASEVQG
ncbi:acyl carrier protein [Streptomyces sp. NPDC014733]|uniref:acyl carrier protein n=1 Tax=Streptomyces sp. NPDC014733 TaxID=3364885 RepID=UPI0036FE3A0F